MAYSPEPLKSKPTGGGDIPPPDRPLATGEGNTARDKAAKEEAHWHVHYAAEAAAQKNRADALREQLDALATSLEQKVAGNKQGPDMGWTHPDEPADQLRREVGYVIEDARAALKERDG